MNALELRLKQIESPKADSDGTDQGSPGALAICAPTVGRLAWRQRPGAIIRAGDAVAALQVLSKRIDLVLPASVGPHVLRTEVPSNSGVAYDTRLGWLEPLADGAVAYEDAGTSVEESLGLPEGSFAVVAPIEGLFYSAPSPEDPSFVEPGQTISPGHIVGLVEVMKFFYEVIYNPTDLGLAAGQKAEVVRVVAENASAVDSSQPVVYCVPLAKP